MMVYRKTFDVDEEMILISYIVCPNYIYLVYLYHYASRDGHHIYRGSR